MADLIEYICTHCGLVFWISKSAIKEDGRNQFIEEMGGYEVTCPCCGRHRHIEVKEDG